MLPAASNRLTRPEPIQYYESLVEHGGALLNVTRLAEGGEFLLHTPEPDFEVHAPSAKEVQARQRVGNDLRATPRRSNKAVTTNSGTTERSCDPGNRQLLQTIERA